MEANLKENQPAMPFMKTQFQNLALLLVILFLILTPDLNLTLTLALFLDITPAYPCLLGTS